MTDSCEYNQEDHCVAPEYIPCRHQGKSMGCNAKVDDLNEFTC